MLCAYIGSAFLFADAKHKNGTESYSVPAMTIDETVHSMCKKSRWFAHLMHTLVLLLAGKTFEMQRWATTSLDGAIFFVFHYFQR